MSVNAEKIFTPITILQKVAVKIGDYELINEDLISVETTWDINQFCVKGAIIFKDTFSLDNLGLFDGKTKVNIFAVDIYGASYERTFIITEVGHDEFNDRFRMLYLNFVDEAYYDLQRMHISQGFVNKSYTEALNAYFDFYGIDDIIDADDIVKNFDDTITKRNFTVPQNISIHDYFVKVLRDEGYRLYQDRDNLYLKEINFSELEFIEDEDADITYSNSTDNNLYAFKIHDYTLNNFGILEMNQERPLIKHFSYDRSTKTMDTSTENLDTVFGSMALNDRDTSEIQQTIGELYSTDAGVNLGKQKLDVEDSYNKNNSLEIVVPGNFRHNTIGKLANITLKGNPIINKTSLEGDNPNSGIYFISRITDKIIGDKMIQKMTLQRVDGNEIR